MSSDEELEIFIQSSFRSIWSLELLLLLKRERRHWPREELVAALRASDLVVAQALESLTAAGLAAADEGGASYLPVNDEVAKLADEAIALYSVKPNAVRRMIVVASTSGITAFADAFKLRKD